MVDVSGAITEPADRVAGALAPGWPSALPTPTLQGYGVSPAAAVQRSPFEIGAARVYRRTRQPLAEVSVAWAMDNFQQALFDSFQRLTLLEGQHWFGVTLAFPSGEATAVARFKGSLGMRFLGGERWLISATLELTQRPTLTEAELDALLDDVGEDPAWPDLLPQPDLKSWEIVPKPVTARGDDLPGLPQTRQRSRNSLAEVQTRWELTADQAAAFDGFFRWRGRDGAQWFSFPFFQGTGFVDTDARFLGEADWQPRAGGRWAVAAPIEVRERQVFTAAELAIVGEDLDGLLAAIDAVHVAVVGMLGEA